MNETTIVTNRNLEVTDMFEHSVHSRVESTHITNTEWVTTACLNNETWRSHNKKEKRNAAFLLAMA